MKYQSPARLKRIATLERECDRFNAAHPIGSTVRVWTGVMGDGPGNVGTVVTPGAYVLGQHTAVVQCTGIRGCVAVDHVRAEVTTP